MLNKILPIPDLVIVWRVTERCNLSCLFCAYGSEWERKRRDASDEMIYTFGEVLKQYAEKYQKTCLVSWLGGEPFLWREWEEMSDFYRTVVNARLSTTTNGIALKIAHIRKKVLDYFDEIVISIDGFHSATDKFRQQEGLFDLLAENIKLLAKEKNERAKSTRIKVNTILMNGNIASFWNFCEELHSWGVQELTFNQLGGNDRPEFYPENRLRPEQVNKLLSEFYEKQNYFSNKGLKIHGSQSYLRRFKASSEGTKIPIDDCKPGSWFLFVDETGKCSPCSFTTKDYGVSIREIKTPEELLNIQNIFSQKRAEKRAAACEDCLSTQVFDKFS